MKATPQILESLTDVSLPKINEQLGREKEAVPES